MSPPETIIDRLNSIIAALCVLIIVTGFIAGVVVSR
jgi:hypothetical protein